MGMLARQFWLLTAFEVPAYAYVAMRYCGGDCSMVGIAFGVALIYICVRLVIVAASFVVTGIVGTPRPKNFQIGMLQAVRVYLQESLAHLFTFCVLQPLESLLGLRHPPPGAQRSEYPILMVHGFVGNAAVWWSLRRRLLRLGFNDVHTINLEPITGDIENLARSLEARVDEILRDSPATKLTLVSHSMGGLVSRVFADRLGGADRLRGIITLGTPHRGTVLARLLSCANVRQMREDSEWLNELNGGGAVLGQTPLISIYSYHDNIVAPQENSRLEWAENLPLEGLGHMALLFAPQCQAAVIQALQRLWMSRPG